MPAENSRFREGFWPPSPRLSPPGVPGGEGGNSPAGVGVRSYKATPSGDRTDGAPAAKTGPAPAGVAQVPPGEVVFVLKGKLTPSLQIAVSPIDVAGEVTEITFVEGKRVKKGEVLARIRDNRYLNDFNTSVATLAYEFFTGKIPSLAGVDYLVSPTGPNTNNLNSAYYQSFNLENRYINFAVNLGKLGEGKDAFAAKYGAMSLFDATREAYKTIFGADLDYRDFNFSLNNTMFGPTRFRNAGLDSNLEVEFKTKVVTDFAFNYNVAKNVTLSFNINNILNVTPKWNMKALNSAGQALLDSKTKDAVTGMTPSEWRGDETAMLPPSPKTA